MDLQLPFQGFNLRPERLEDFEMEIIRRRLKRVLKRKRGVKSTIISHENAKPEDPQIEKYREAIFERFGKTVLTAEVIPDPPVRGPYGYAYIPLKEHAIPQREKPFKMHGEREEAHRRFTKDWMAHKFIERVEGPSEWLPQSFVVPKNM